MAVSPIQIAPQGPVFSRIVLGLWRIADAPVKSHTEINTLIQHALDLGITTFDHADIYGGYTCEALFGAALKLNSSARQKMQLISKCGIKLVSSNRPEHKLKSYDTSSQHILESVDRSLKNLGTDYLDMLLLHRPDPLLNPDEVAEAFDTLKNNGKVRWFGVSNYSPAQFEMLQSRLTIPLVCNQIEISPLYLDPFTNGQLDHCLQHRIRPMAWSPFGGGDLFKNESIVSKRVLLTLKNMETQHPGADVSQLILAWLMKHPSGILPVIGTGNINRLRSLSESEKISLSTEEWFDIWTAASGQEVP